MTDYSERASKLRVLWNKGRNMYSAFYSELNEARREIGDEQFANWCFTELRISLSILNEAARLLKSADAGVVRTELARAVQANKEIVAHARQAAKEERERLAEQKKREQAELRKERKHAARVEYKKAWRENKAIALRRAMPENAELSRLLAECATIEKTSRAELGRHYMVMKEIVQTQKAGRDERGEHWTWGKWSRTYIDRSPRDIDRCIVEFQTSCLNKQEENVIQFPQIVA
jgi:hypothetical protein